MPAEAAANFRRNAGLAANDKRRTNALLEQSYALRHCGRRDVEYTRGALEAALSRHGPDGGQQ
jgi:hypothetical protein